VIERSIFHDQYDNVIYLAQIVLGWVGDNGRKLKWGRSSAWLDS
jgi:hypothetical protein